MVVTLFGIVMSVKRVHQLNAYSPILVTLLGIANEPILLAGHATTFVLYLSYRTPSMAEKNGLAGSTMIFVRPKHRKKALPFILLRPLEMEIVVSPLA